MRIGIDARFLTHPQLGGFKTYIENLIAALAEVDTDNEYVLYLDRSPDHNTRLPNRLNFTSHVVPGLLPVFGMPWREQVELARQAARDKLDLLHSPSLTAPLRLTCPLVVTIHDMIWFFPERFSNGKHWSAQRKLMEWYYRLVPQFAARHASAILTVSEAAKQSIVHHLGITADKVWVTYEAASHIYRPVDDAHQIEAVRQKYELTSEFILAIGSADPRKNLSTLVKAYALLPTTMREQYKLVIVWTHHFLATELADQVEELELTTRVQFLKQVPNEDLVLLYNAAALFVFPSLYEGFGLPPLEAMACGTPVVAANNSSIPEIVGDAALLVQAQDTEGMAAMIAQVLTGETVQTSLAEKGLRQAARFSWEKCARQTIAGYSKSLLA
jgi:glycosyltransferase involved in cell wall biosynthesis